MTAMDGPTRLTRASVLSVLDTHADDVEAVHASRP